MQMQIRNIKKNKNEGTSVHRQGESTSLNFVPEIPQSVQFLQEAFNSSKSKSAAKMVPVNENKCRTV